jgi:hypothetical protein
MTNWGGAICDHHYVIAGQRVLLVRHGLALYTSFS